MGMPITGGRGDCDGASQLAPADPHRTSMGRRDRAAALVSAFDHAAGDAGTRVACGLALLVIDFGVNDDGFADDAVIAVQRHALGDDIDVGFAIGVGLDVTEVAGVVGVLVTGAAVMVRAGGSKCPPALARSGALRSPFS